MAPQEEWVQGFGSAPARKSSSYIAPGGYRIRITSLVKQTSRNPKTRGNVLVVFEGQIVQVITEFGAAPHPSNPAKPGWPASNKVGEPVAVIFNLSKNAETSMSNLKALLLACLQAAARKAGLAPPEESQLTSEQWEAALVSACAGAGTKFAGLELVCHASRTTTKADDAFTPLRWEAYVPPAPAPAS